MIRKLGDTSVFAAELGKFITRLKEGNKKKNNEDHYEGRSHAEEFVKQGVSNRENQHFNAKEFFNGEN